VSAYASATEAEVAARTKTAADTIDRTFREVIAARNASQSSAERLAAAQTLSDLSQKKSELQRASNVFGNGVDFVRGATMDGAKVPGPPVREVALGFILGVVIAAISAWLRADRDRRVLDPLRPEALLDAPLLAAVPREEAARCTPLRARGGAPSSRAGCRGCRALSTGPWLPSWPAGSRPGCSSSSAPAAPRTGPRPRSTSPSPSPPTGATSCSSTRTRPGRCPSGSATGCSATPSRPASSPTARTPSPW
jgi:hypothetical protein